MVKGAHSAKPPSRISVVGMCLGDALIVHNVAREESQVEVAEDNARVVARKGMPCDNTSHIAPRSLQLGGDMANYQSEAVPIVP
eukprot:6460906-Amphidinium_carterae.1